MEAERKVGMHYSSNSEILSGNDPLITVGCRRHFAVIGAVAVIVVQGFDFFVQNLVTFPIEPWEDTSLSKPLPSNSEELFTEWQNNNTNNSDPNLQLPHDLQIARIANATNYNSTNVGNGPCKCSTL